MGMFTTIFDPKTQKSFQIKTGKDWCDTYSVGDKVRYWVDPNIARCGALFDGVYLGIGGIDDSFDEEAWVVIKNSFVATVEPWSKDHQSSFKSILEKKYDIQEPPRELWTEEAWKRHDEIHAQIEKENEEFMQSISHLSGKDQLAAIMGQYIRRKLNQPSPYVLFGLKMEDDK